MSQDHLTSTPSEYAIRAGQEAWMTTFDGGCHCGNATIRFETAKAPTDFQPRACQCSFCRMHGTRTASDPAGRLHLSVRNPGLLSRYRFSLKTADYLVCRTC